MNQQTKKKIKDIAKTTGKYTLKGGMKLAQSAFKATGAIAKNKYARKLAVYGITALAAIEFAPLLILAAGTKYALDSTIGGNANLFKDMKDIASLGTELAKIPTNLLADLVEGISDIGDKGLQKGIDYIR